MVLELLLIPFLTFQGRGIPKLEKIMHRSCISYKQNVDLHSLCMKYRTACYFQCQLRLYRLLYFLLTVWDYGCLCSSGSPADFNLIFIYLRPDHPKVNSVLAQRIFCNCFKSPGIAKSLLHCMDKVATLCPLLLDFEFSVAYYILLI